MNKCPYCGAEDYLYSIEHMRYEQYYDYNGEPQGYSDGSDPRPPRKNVPLYCVNCGKRVTTLKALEDA